MGLTFSKRAWHAQHLPDTEFAAEGEDTSTVNTKRLARFIKQGFLAPIWSRDGEEDPENVSVPFVSRRRAGAQRHAMHGKLMHRQGFSMEMSTRHRQESTLLYAIASSIP